MSGFNIGITFLIKELFFGKINSQKKGAEFIIRLLYLFLSDNRLKY